MSDWALGLEIGGTKLQAALGSRDGIIAHRQRGAADSSAGAESILSWFDHSIPALLEQAAKDGPRVTAIGVGFGGPVDSAAGTALVSHQVGGWSGFPLKRWFEERFDLPATIANDANAAGWAEYCCGAGKGTRTFCYMNIGSGIGGAFVINGQLHDGHGFGAAEIGHTYVPDFTSPAPGAADKLEHLCSGWSIEKRVRMVASLEPSSPLAMHCSNNPNAITCAMLADAAREGDPVALQEIEQVAAALGHALSKVITLIHPEFVALGGGVRLMGDVLLDPIRKHVDALVFGPYRDRYRIVPCALGEDVVLVGGLLLASATSR
ncbi:MAG: ROK family protein [Candidatus Hydrogenedentes bacterium]|nr:ROK family protein [Candidatus Hydrogenedentota bacterium]